MRESESLFFDIRALRYHVRRWPTSAAPKLVLLHGWMDVSASFQFMVDAFARRWDVYAPAKGDPELLERDLGTVFYCAGLTADYDRRPFDASSPRHVSIYRLCAI